VIIYPTVTRQRGVAEANKIFEFRTLGQHAGNVSSPCPNPRVVISMI